MNKKNNLFIAISLGDYITDNNGKIDWLHAISNPNNYDKEYVEFTNQIDVHIIRPTIRFFTPNYKHSDGINRSNLFYNC